MVQEPPLLPSATYRLQFNKDFTFRDAAALVPYLSDLGISHCYASPYLKARAGSAHGYDIVDHSAFNPEIGSEEDFLVMADALASRGMGQLLDMVPNHMGVGGSDNQWWLDVLENGQASPYAGFFDIDWHPLKPELRNKVLLPFLGGHYGDVLEGGELKLAFDDDTGSFSVWYYQHRFPVDPKTYPLILGDGVTDAVMPERASAALRSVLKVLEELPPSWQTDAASRDKRLLDKDAGKKRLAELWHRYPSVKRYVQRCVDDFKGEKGNPSSYDRLHRLLEKQPYRLSYWHVASHEINYRRFFDINDLAGLCMEKEEVFHASHTLILRLIADCRLHGLRIDHIDGLYDPLEYCRRLREAADRARADVDSRGSTERQALGEIYLVIEKILAGHEYLSGEWPVQGTTGYEFANLVNGLFVYGGAERLLTRVYRRFTGRRVEFDDLLYERKKLIMHAMLSSELNVLANILNRISEADRHARDFTVNGLRDALVEIAASFPVYRTYVTGEKVNTEDRRYVDWAVALAKKRTPATDIGVFDFAQRVLLLDWPPAEHPLRPMAVHFSMKFQQYTAPVMAKSMEDTVFYIYNRLVSLNEVGGDPRRFGVSVAAFHHLNQERQRFWPRAMLNTSTHDTKRGEDVRARINVLSEAAEEWRRLLGRWSRLNRRHKIRIDETACPGRNDEYLLYQTLAGIWPLGDLDETGLAELRRRVEQYMLKAVREAKIHTSWVKPNTAYEEAVSHFVGALLGRLTANPFLSDFLEFKKLVAYFGMFNSLAQLVLKLTVPGVPDIYQGNELWCFNLVDPDNRRPVDYAVRRRCLDQLKSAAGETAGTSDLAARLLDVMEDGRVKLYLTWRLLSLRRLYPDVLGRGEYLPLQVEGKKAEHLCAFMRRHEERTLLVAVPRWFYKLCGSLPRPPVGAKVWEDTCVVVPGLEEGASLINALTGERTTVRGSPGGPCFTAGELLRTFPFAVLTP